jgi:glutathione S-transferase
MIQLLSSPPSPFARKIRVLLLETAQGDVEIVQVAASPLGPDATIAAATPLAKIPALVRDDGPTLYDSRVVSQYLNARAKADFYPQSCRWETLTLEATGDGLMDAAVLIVYEKRTRPEGKWHQPWIDGQWAKVARTLDALEDKWMSHLLGPLDAGHIAVGCGLSYLDFRHADRDWREGHHALADWYTKFAERPSMIATAPPAA